MAGLDGGGVTELFMAFHKNKKVVLHDRVMDETNEVTTSQLFEMFSSVSANPWAAMNDFAAQWARSRLEDLTRATHSEYDSIQEASNNSRNSFVLRKSKLTANRARKSSCIFSQAKPAVESAANCRSGASLWRRARQPLTVINILGGFGTQKNQAAQSLATSTKASRNSATSRWTPAVARIAHIRMFSVSTPARGDALLDPLDEDPKVLTEACKLRQVLSEQPGAQPLLNPQSPELPKAQHEIWPKFPSVSASVSGDASRPGRERDTSKSQFSFPGSHAKKISSNQRHLRKLTSEEPTATPSLQTTAMQKTSVVCPPNSREQRPPAPLLAPLPGGTSGLDTTHRNSELQDENTSRQGPDNGWKTGMEHGKDLPLTSHEPYETNQFLIPEPPTLVFGKSVSRSVQDKKDEGKANLLRSNGWTDSLTDGAALRPRARLQNMNHVPGYPSSQEPSGEHLPLDPPTRLDDHLSRPHDHLSRPHDHLSRPHDHLSRPRDLEGLLPGRRKEAALPRSCGLRSLVMQQYISTMNAQTHTTREVWPLPQNQNCYAHVLCTRQARSKT